MRNTSLRTAAAVVVGALLVPFAPAVAVSSGVGNAKLTWKIHECAFAGAFVTTANSATDSCGSIREDQTITGNAAKGADGWTFSGGVGTRDAATGEAVVNFTGSVRLGNVNRGNYFVEFKDPSVTVDSTGAGSLKAEVVYKDPVAETSVSAGRVQIAALADVPDSDPWTVTPPWVGVGTPDLVAPLDGKQFGPEFVNVLPESMRNWFRASSSAEATGSRSEYNSYKTIAPVSVEFGAPDSQWNPTLQIINGGDIRANETRTITVVGSGFNPALQGGAVNGIYVVFGPNPASVPNGYADPNIFGAAQYLPAGPGSDGTFQTTLTVKGPYLDSNGATWDPAVTPFGVSTWAAHRRATTLWDSFAAVAIAPAAAGANSAAPRKVRLVKVVKISGNRVTVKWARAKSGSQPTGYKVRISKRNSTKFKKWVTTSNAKAVLTGVRKSGRYRIQIKAMGQAGSSPAIAVVVRRR